MREARPRQTGCRRAPRRAGGRGRPGPACFLALLAAFLPHALWAASEWPHLRGPGQDGHCPDADIGGLRTNADVAVLWKRAIGEGYSGFAISGRRAFTQAQTRAGQFLICLDLFDGSVLWQTRYEWPWGKMAEYPGPFASPTCRGNDVFFLGGYGTAGCADAADGRLRWTVDLPRTLGAATPGFGHTCTPLVLHDRVFLHVGKGCSVVALNAADGSVVWRTETTRVGYASPIAVTVGGARQIVCYLENILMACDPESGAELWRHPWSVRYDPHPAWPVYREPYLFCASAFRRGSSVLDLSFRDGRPAVRQVWKNNRICNDVLSSVIVGDHVYGFDIRDLQGRENGRTRGSFKCLELETGRECWSAPQTGHASVMACGRNLLLLNENGILIVIEATPDAYRERLRVPILPGELCWTMPALAGGHLLVRSQTQVACVRLGRAAARPVDAGPVAMGRDVRWIDRRMMQWLDQYGDEAMVSPGFADLAAWYACILLGVFMPAWALTCLARRSPLHRVPLFAVLALALGLAGTVVYSALLHRFLFTWPAVLFVLFMVLLAAYRRAAATPGWKAAFVARLGLVLFAAACFLFYHLCRRWFLTAGWGFLSGLFFACPIAAWSDLRRRPPPRGLRAAFIDLAAFSAFFASSAILLVWKTTRGEWAL